MQNKKSFPSQLFIAKEQVSNATIIAFSYDLLQIRHQTALLEHQYIFKTPINLSLKSHHPDPKGRPTRLAESAYKILYYFWRDGDLVVLVLVG
jgi:hypothetical protein